MGGFLGVRVGQVSIHEGTDVHTGVTVIFPRGVKDTTYVPCYAAVHEMNVAGEWTGLNQIREWGFTRAVCPFCLSVFHPIRNTAIIPFPISLSPRPSSKSLLKAPPPLPDDPSFHASELLELTIPMFSFLTSKAHCLHKHHKRRQSLRQPLEMDPSTPHRRWHRRARPVQLLRLPHRRRNV